MRLRQSHFTVRQRHPTEWLERRLVATQNAASKKTNKTLTSRARRTLFGYRHREDPIEMCL